MKPLLVKYRDHVRLYNLNDEYHVSTFLVQVCCDLDLSPARVDFRTVNGELLPEDGILSEIPGFLHTKLVKIFVDDVPLMTDFQPTSMETSIRAAKSCSVSASVIIPSKGISMGREVHPDDTIASLVGDVIAKNYIDLDLEITSGNSRCGKSSRDRSPLRTTYSASDLPLRLIEDMGLESGDVLNVTDKLADTKYKRIHPEVSIEFPGVTTKYSFNAKDSVSETLGKILESGKLGTAFKLLPEKDSKKPLTAAMFNDADEPFKDGASFILKTCQVKDLKSQNSIIIFVRFASRGGWRDVYLPISWSTTVSEFCQSVYFNFGLRDHVADIIVHGQSLKRSKCALNYDHRSLISDCKLKSFDTLVINPTSKPQMAQAIWLHSSQNLETLNTFNFDVTANGKEITRTLSKIFNVPSQKTFRMVFQLGRQFHSDSPEEVESGAQPLNSVQCINHEVIEWSPVENLSHGDVKGRALTKRVDRSSKRLMHVVTSDQVLRLTQKAQPKVYFIDDIEYYCCSKDHSAQVEHLLTSQSPWRNLKYVAFFMGVQVKDLRDENSVIQFFPQVGNLYSDVSTGELFRRDEIAQSENIDIPLESRDIGYFIVFMTDGAKFPRYRLSDKFNLRVWTRCGFQLSLKNGVISSIKTPYNGVFGWYRAYRGSSFFESCVTRHLRSTLS